MLKLKIREAIIDFNLSLNCGYKIEMGENEMKGLLINFLKKALRSYFMWGFVGSLRKNNISMCVKDGHLAYMNITFDPIYQVWMKERVKQINDVIDELDFEELYSPSMILGKFCTKTDKLIDSIKDFKF